MFLGLLSMVGKKAPPATSPDLHPSDAGLDSDDSPVTRFMEGSWKLYKSSVLVRYLTYVAPIVLALLIPLLLGAMVYKGASVGGVQLAWFTAWLEFVWLSLWAGRITSKMIPHLFGITAGCFTNAPNKWRDMSRMLEVPTTLFFWALATHVSFLPAMCMHHVNGNRDPKRWEENANVSLLVTLIGAILNLAEKIIIQLIAISFHTRTYAHRIELNKFQVKSLAKLYESARNKENNNKFDCGDIGSDQESKAIDPKAFLATRNRAKRALSSIRDMAGRIAGDFTERKINDSRSPSQVVLALLATTEGCTTLARYLYHWLCRESAEKIRQFDLQEIFIIEEETEAAFAMFDRDINGNVSREEMELACIEIGHERRSITASLRDLDGVVGRFDNCLTLIVFIATTLIFLSLISKLTAGALVSTSNSVLALSWLFSATAQELLTSIVFVFVKHPFDVGDRVDIYQDNGEKETFFVNKMTLMYTEFRRPEGHIVQAPNSLLNSLFILNMRRSGALAEAIPIVVKFGTTMDQIEALRVRMLEFVKTEKREYKGKILTELRDIPAMHAVNLNVVFFYKSNWQNELVRLHRRNKFMCALMCNVAEIGIESPNARRPGQKASAPIYISCPAGSQLQDSPRDGRAPPRIRAGSPGDFTTQSPPQQPPAGVTTGRDPSVRSATNHDFSLGIREVMAIDDSADLFGGEEPRQAVDTPLGPLGCAFEEDWEQQLTRESSRQHLEDLLDSHGTLQKRSLSGLASLEPRGSRFFRRTGWSDDEMVLPTTECGT